MLICMELMRVDLYGAHGSCSLKGSVAWFLLLTWFLLPGSCTLKGSVALFLFSEGVSALFLFSEGVSSLVPVL